MLKRPQFDVLILFQTTWLHVFWVVFESDYNFAEKFSKMTKCQKCQENINKTTLYFSKGKINLIFLLTIWIIFTEQSLLFYGHTCLLNVIATWTIYCIFHFKGRETKRSRSVFPHWPRAWVGRQTVLLSHRVLTLVFNDFLNGLLCIVATK